MTNSTNNLEFIDRLRKMSTDTPSIDSGIDQTSVKINEVPPSLYPTTSASGDVSSSYEDPTPTVDHGYSTPNDEHRYKTTNDDQVYPTLYDHHVYLTQNDDHIILPYADDILGNKSPEIPTITPEYVGLMSTPDVDPTDEITLDKLEWTQHNVENGEKNEKLTEKRREDANNDEEDERKAGLKDDEEKKIVERIPCESTGKYWSENTTRCEKIFTIHKGSVTYKVAYAPYCKKSKICKNSENEDEQDDVNLPDCNVEVPEVSKEDTLLGLENLQHEDARLVIKDMKLYNEDHSDHILNVHADNADKLNGISQMSYKDERKTSHPKRKETIPKESPYQYARFPYDCDDHLFREDENEKGKHPQQLKRPENQSSILSKTDQTTGNTDAYPPKARVDFDCGQDGRSELKAAAAEDKPEQREGFTTQDQTESEKKQTLQSTEETNRPTGIYPPHHDHHAHIHFDPSIPEPHRTSVDRQQLQDLDKITLSSPVDTTKKVSIEHHVVKDGITQEELRRKLVDKVIFTHCADVINDLMGQILLKTEDRQGRRKKRTTIWADSHGCSNGYSPSGWNKCNGLSLNLACGDVGTYLGDKPIIRTGKNSQNLGLGTSLFGEIAFQLEWRVLDYVFGGKHNKKAMLTRDYTLGNIMELMEIQAKFDPNDEVTYYRYKRLKTILSYLASLGYEISKHSAMCGKLITKYGLLTSFPYELCHMTNTGAVMTYINRMCQNRLERSCLYTCMTCLKFMARRENRPVFIVH